MCFASKLLGVGILLRGSSNAEALSVEIEMRMNPDATVRTARVVDGVRMNSDPFFRAAAESALRALSHPDCIPLKLPVGKYEVWKSFTFNFDPKICYSDSCRLFLWRLTCYV